MQLDKDALLLARTHFHTLGSARNFKLNDATTSLYFTRSSSSTSNIHCLWQLDIASGAERLLFDPLKHLSDSQPTAEELKQREVLRETSHGITSYALSQDGSRLCFTCNGSLWLLPATSGSAKSYNAAGPAFDARFSPDGTMISFVNGEGIWTIGLDTSAKPDKIIDNESPDIYYGRAEFIASEEFERYRGYWWSPDSKQLVVTRVDESVIQHAYGFSDEPQIAPAPSRYPFAGTPNAAISLFVCDIATKKRHEIIWDSAAHEYLANVQWNASGLYITVESRNQTSLQLLQVSDTGKTKTIYSESSQPWVDILQPLPLVTAAGKVIGLAASMTHKRQLTFDGVAITPAEHHVDDFIGTFGDWLIYTASPDPKERIVFAVHSTTKASKQLSPSGGLFSGSTTSGAVFVAGSSMGGAKQRMLYASIEAEPVQLEIASLASKPKTLPQPIFFTVGLEELQACLVLPKRYTEHTKGAELAKLPVIVQVYGGPHHQEVLFSQSSYLEAQWWADQGYAVLTIDGPGSPGKDLAWEQRIFHDFIREAAAAHSAVLCEALLRYPFLDAKRVASRGWSFGGYLSAFLSVLYPQQFQASISVAPVTDWKLYDTHYTERYLGRPEANPDEYEASSLLVAARKAYRPILLVHGLQDENVMFAHSLKLLEVLGEACCPYQFIPLSQVSHFPKEAEQRAWLLHMERDFLRSQLTASQDIAN